MSRRIITPALALLIAALACNAPAEPPAPTPAAGAPLSDAASTLVPTAATPSAPVQATPTAAGSSPEAPTSAPAAPRFNAEILFAPTPDPAAAARSFAAGVTEIYALWGYSGMTAAMTVRREWYLDGVLWIEREEAWDFAKYGASGAVRDISIYERDADGLPAGHYELRLFIDGAPQFSSADDTPRSFDIVQEAASPELPSDDGTLVAYIEGESMSKLVVDDAATGQRVIEIFDEADPNNTQIAGFDWLPVGHYLVYSIMYPHPEGFPFPDYALWIVHVDSGTVYPIGEREERLHHPVASPDGRYVAVIRGTGYGDACVVDSVVAVVELHTAVVQRVGLYSVYDFAGLPQPTGFEGTSAAYTVDAPGYPAPGVWMSSSRLRTALRWTCVEGPNTADGVYDLELNGLTAQKVGAIPGG